MDEDVTVRISADAAPFLDTMRTLTRLSERFGAELTGGLRSAAVSGRSLEDVLRRVALNLAGMALNEGLAPLRNLASGLFSGLFGAMGKVTPFAKGGVVAAPTYFSTGAGTGLMGEAGAEAILPLRRGADGRLGVASANAAPVNVVFNVTTPDVGGFARSEAQITAMLARAAARGSRRL